MGAGIGSVRTLIEPITYSINLYTSKLLEDQSPCYNICYVKQPIWQLIINELQRMQARSSPTLPTIAN